MERDSPVDVVGLASGGSDIDVGQFHACALTQAGGVKCWGSGVYGSLGDGTETDHYSPVDVVGLASGVVDISVGSGYSCALLKSGGVKCWGENNRGQLGDGTDFNRDTPVDVTGLNGVISFIDAGPTHTCVLTQVGGVKCWGVNDYGQLGDGTTTDHNTPVDVVGLASGVRTIRVGYMHTCALMLSGEVKCWGINGEGELGDGTTIDRYTPVDVIGPANGVRDIATGMDFSCALMQSGGVKCWGSNAEGQLGDGTYLRHYTPMDVIGFP